MPAIEEQLAELTGRVDQYPSERYPVQHATAQFHLGTAMLQLDRPGDALGPLTVAEEMFEVAGMRLERAKAANMRGVALRTTGHPREAAPSFGRAAAIFHTLDHPLEEAAASYNLGLTCCEVGETDDARQAFTHAAQLFLAAGRMSEAAAAAREKGTMMLTLGEIQGAVDVLTPAVEMAFGCRDMAGAGAAANVLGLAHLAAGDLADAAAAFRDALGAHPRSVRPAEHAMAKANLALALERSSDQARARLAAGQAMGIRTADSPVRAQAEAILQRLPPATGVELFEVLDDTPPDRWTAVVREEVLRWADAPETVRASAAVQWIDGQLAQHGRGPQFAEALLGAVLELPPDSYELVIRAVVAAVATRSDDEATQFRASVRSGMVRFAIPQWQRLAGTFNSLSTQLGQPAEWS